MNSRIRILNPIDGKKWLTPNQASHFIERGHADIVTVDGRKCLNYRPGYIRMRQGLLSADREASRFNTAPIRQIGNSRRGQCAPINRSGPTPEELHWRESVLNRDSYKCVFCGATEQLEADHVKPKSVFPDLKYEVSNGRTLCKRCHCQTDTYGRRSGGIHEVEPIVA